MGWNKYRDKACFTGIFTLQICLNGGLSDLFERNELKIVYYDNCTTLQKLKYMLIVPFSVKMME